MVDFALTDEQQQLRALAREFAEKEIAPKAAHHDQTGEFPREICRKAWELGLMNTHVPEAYGGPGLGVLDGCMIAEEIAWGCTGIGTAMEANTLAEAPVIVGGSDEQKRRFLAPMTKEFRLAAYCVTEPQAGSDVQGIKTVARKAGDDYVLKGSKMWITNGSVADWYFVVAYTDPSQRYKGMSAFVVPRDSPGIEVGKKEQNLGQRASDTRAVTFNDVKVTREVAEILRTIEGRKVVEMDPILGGEDFSRFLQKAPGTFYYLGTRNKSKGCIYPNHSSKFKVDEDVLKYGSVSLASLALEFARR